jgi:polysaccharide deacetylase 2 family uncharacterized protein YibQ
LRRTPGARIAAAFVMGLLQSAICSADTPYLAVIIDDLGNARTAGERAAALPGAATCSILPHTPFATHLAELCMKRCSFTVPCSLRILPWTRGPVH